MINSNLPSFYSADYFSKKKTFTVTRKIFTLISIYWNHASAKTHETAVMHTCTAYFFALWCAKMNFVGMKTRQQRLHFDGKYIYLFTDAFISGGEKVWPPRRPCAATACQVVTHIMNRDRRQIHSSVFISTMLSAFTLHRRVAAFRCDTGALTALSAGY